MSLDWFPFNIKDFLANTKRLNTEAKGAYLCLMLDFYEQQKGPPDDDDILAAITELSPEVWKRHRKVIEPLFDVKEGIWHHSRMEREIADAMTKIERTKTNAKAGAAARWRNKDAPALPPASTEDGVDAHLTLNNKNSLSAREREPLLVLEERKPEPDGIGTPIDPEYTPSPELVATCHADGASDAVIAIELKKFVADKQESGAFSHNWDASWVKWWDRWRTHRDKIAKPRGAPRIEVNSEPFVPTEKQWATAAGMFAKGIRWPKAGYGPEPGMIGCRCPHVHLSAVGIDPATGMKIRGGQGISIEGASNE